jgi:putative beta-lysine N-acetyltransferase
MSDIIEIIGNSVVRHGPVSDRVYLMKLGNGDYPGIAGRLDRLAFSRGYSKVFAKIPAGALQGFTEEGYLLEATIPGFFPDGDDACFLGKYLDPSRREERKPQLLRKILSTAEEQEPVSMPLSLPEGFDARIAVEGDTTEMAEVYHKVFATYPFPIHEPAFLRTSMYDTTVYFGVWNGEGIAALSSAEMDPPSRSAEMTDFATLPEFRGSGLALYLLQQMEETMKSRGIRSLYTIARAYSFGINITFARNGYRFGGTLTNNTNISGNLESMNVWYKQLPDTGYAD